MENSRLDALRRKNLGTTRKARLVQNLRSIGVPESVTTFLALEESDQVRHRAHKAFSARNEILSDVLERRFLLTGQDEAWDIVPTRTGEVFVIPWDAEIVGVLKWPVNVLNALWQRLAKLEPDGWIIVDDNFQNKVVIQVVDDSEEKEVDLGVWGDLWKKQVEQISIRH